MTVLAHLLSVFQHSASYNRHDLARPGVILWTDGERLWEKAVRLIASSCPGFFQLDENGLGEFSGPSTWVRYQLGKWSGESVPVVYLPGIYRHQFRRAAGFPEVARHLYALQFQGQFCSQLNGKDWTPAAILASEDGGLGLRVARDRATQQALGDQLEAVLRTPVAALRGKQLEASDFHDLAISDPVRLVLDWMNAPEKAAKDWPESQYAAFLAYCKKDLGFHPEKDGLITAVEKVTSAAGKWANVWNRFEDLAQSLPGVRKALDLVQPADLFSISSNPRIPATNRRLEEELRKGLVDSGNLPPSKARAALLTLATVHSSRAGSVYARLGEAPLAKASTHLQRMLAGMQTGVAGTDCASIGEAYLAGAWVVDAEARRAWESARKSEDCGAVSAALRATYLPWLEDLAFRLQDCASGYPVRSRQDARDHAPEPGTVILFVDGLRADLAKELMESMAQDGLQIEATAQWSALPSVTATAKPAWNPLAKALHGHEASA
ncbi:MAG: BREX-1 system phosphatase PglZ type B [Verrucomicrobia bacterium]|nr:BREX-1 system phosphatase PglZ type B [Verrucomicrobiota bacterium]